MAGCVEVFVLQLLHDVDDVVHPSQIAVFMVGFSPGSAMIQGDPVGEGCGFAKVDHPDVSFVGLVMYE